MEGKFKSTKSENFDEFLKALGTSFVLRTAAKTSTPVVHITSTGPDSYSMKTVTTFKTTECNFKLGEEFEEERLDGAKVKSTVTLEGNKFTHTQVGDKTVVITREVTGDELICTFTVDNVVSTRVYTRC